MEFRVGHVILERFVRHPSEMLNGYHKTLVWSSRERILVWEPLM